MVHRSYQIQIRFFRVMPQLCPDNVQSFQCDVIPMNISACKIFIIYIFLQYDLNTISTLPPRGTWIIRGKISNNSGFSVLTYLPLNKMAAISQTTFSSSFSWMKMLEFRIKFHWHLWPGTSIGSGNGLASNRQQAIRLPEPILTKFIDAYMRH